MSQHKPECPANWGVGEMPEGPCTFCEMLSACEQRVANEIWGAIREGSQYKSGFEGGLDAAREAVVALTPRLKVEKYEGGYDCCGCLTTYDLMEDALAAIDALLKEQT